MKIIEMLSSNKNHYTGVNKKLYITVHETDNTSKGAGAINHGKYINNGSSTTWHYSVDDTNIVKHFDESIQCWHCGDGRGNGNLNSIGVEMCVNSDSDFNKTILNTVDLIKYLMNKFNIPIENVVPHNKWSGKNCPRNILAGKPTNWAGFKHLIATNSNDRVDSETLYRVQIGAYSNRSNAERLVKELKLKGYDSFIVKGER